MLPQLYLAQPPSSALRRRQLRAFALELRDRLQQIADGPCSVILQTAGDSGAIDVAILRPHSLTIGLLKTADAPLILRHDHPWLLEVRQVRATFLARLGLLARSNLTLGTPIAAVVVTPALPAGSQIALDVEDHRQRVKVLEIGELVPLVSMLQADAQLDIMAMQQITAQIAAQHWHDGTRLLFEIGSAPFVLRVLGRDSAPLILLEGATIIGRREQPIQYEYRLTITGDDSISADHAILICDGDRVVLRDTSTNGTLVCLIDGVERLLQRNECSIETGTVIRLGETEVRLERAQ